MSARCSGGSDPTGVPSHVTVPDVGGASPASTRNSVVFPTPFGPTTSASWRGAELEVEPLEQTTLAAPNRELASANAPASSSYSFDLS